MKTLRLLAIALALLPCLAPAQNQNVQQVIATKALTVDIVVPSTKTFRFAEGSAPGTPASGTVVIYAKSDGKLYSKDDAGTETELGGGGGGGSGDVVGPASSTDNALARFDSTTGKLLQNSGTTLSDAGAFSFVDGVRQTFNPDGTNAGLNAGSQAGDPSSPSNGDLWYDSTANELTARINGSNVALGAGGGGIGGSTGSTDNALLRADGTGGSTVQSSTVTVSDAGVVTASGFVGGTGVFSDVTMATNSSTAVGSRSAFRAPLVGTDSSSWGFMSASTIASGGGTTSLGAEAGTDRANTRRFRLSVSSASSQLVSDATGTETANPMLIVAPTSIGMNIVGTGVVGEFTSTGLNSLAVTFPEASAPSTPASAHVVVYAKSDGRMYSKDDAGTEVALGVAGAGTGDVVGPGSSTDEAIARFDSTTGKLLQNSTTTLSDAGAFSFADGVRQTFNPDGTNAGLNTGSQAGDPSSPSNGDLWYDSTANELTARINGSNVALGAGGGGGGTALFVGRSAKTSAYTIVAGDKGYLIDCTSGTFSLSLDPAATLTSGFHVGVYNSGTGVITLDPNSTETIRGPDGSATTKVLAQGEGAILMCDGAGFVIAASPGVVGPSSATANALVRFNSTTGKLVKTSNVTLADSGTAFVFSAAGGITATGNIILTPTGGSTDTFYQLRASAATASTSTSTGSLVVQGGIGLDGAIWAGTTVNASRVTGITGSGAGGTRGPSPFIIHQSITPVGNVGTGEDTLISTSLVSNTLFANGDRIRARAAFTFAANANNKTLKGKYGSTTFFDSTPLAINGGSAVIEVVVTRLTNTTQNVSVTVNSSNTTLPNSANFTTAAETLSPGTVSLLFTGEATSNDDISQKEVVIEYMPVP